MKLSAYSVGISDFIADDDTNKKLLMLLMLKKRCSKFN